MNMVRILILSLITLLASGAAYSAEADISAVEKFFLEGKYGKAIAEADDLIDGRARHRDELYYLKGLSELKTGKFKDARQSFEHIISKYRHSARVFDAHMGIGDAYFLEGDPKEALGVYDGITRTFPKDRNISVVYERIAECHNKLGMLGKAKEYMSKTKDAPSFSPKREQPTQPGRPVLKVPKELHVEEGQLFSVQVGSFRNKRNAERLIRRLLRNGYEGYIEIPVDRSERLYRVRIGRLQSPEEARALERRLKASGYRTKICSDVSCE